MVLPAMRQVILTEARRVDHNIIDAIGNQKLHRVRVQGVDLEFYSRESDDMELIQWEIETGTDSVRLACTPRLLLLSTTMKAILAEPEKRTDHVKITVMNAEDKNRITKNGI